MRAVVGLLAVILALLSGGAVWAQEPRGWIGADTQDVTKAEAEKLGWDGPRGAKVKLVAPGSPADKAGVKEGDIVEVIDGTEVETSAAFEASVAAKPKGADVRLRVRSGGRERRVAVTVAEPPRGQSADQADVPILMLDTGGHMALIRGPATTRRSAFGIGRRARPCAPSVGRLDRDPRAKFLLWRSRPTGAGWRPGGG